MSEREEETSPARDANVESTAGVGRRTIVKGAAWSVPVIAMAVAAPLAAASGSPTLAFTQPRYTGTACQSITGVRVKRTSDGTKGEASKSVTVTLAKGYTFADGSTTYTGVTGSDGTVLLPDIKVPAAGGDATFAATSDSLSATAPVTAPATGTATQYNSQTGRKTDYSAVPAGASAVGIASYLTSNGSLFFTDTNIATGVSSASAEYDTTEYPRLTYVTSAGGFQYNTQTGLRETYASVPSTAKAVGIATFLTPNGDLYFENTVIARGVSSAAATYDTAGYVRITYVTSGGGYQYNTQTKLTESYSNVPSNAKVVGVATFLAPNGNLYFPNSVLASGVTSASSEYDTHGYPRITYVTSSGGHQYNSATGRTDSYSSVPAGATAVGIASFLGDNGNLYLTNQVIASGVHSAKAEYDSHEYPRLSYVSSPAC